MMCDLIMAIKGYNVFDRCVIFFLVDVYQNFKVPHGL